MSQAVVARIKAELEARGVDLQGSCGAFAITKRVVWALKDQGAGLLAKPGGENCEGFKTDAVAFKDGTYADCLISAGQDNGPAWQVSGPFDDIPGRWRAPIDPGDVPTPPDTSLPPSADYTALVKRLGVMQEQIDRNEAAQEALEARVDAVEDRPTSGPIPGQMLAELLAFQAALSVVIERISRLIQVIPR